MVLSMYDITKIHHLHPRLCHACLFDERVLDVHTSLQSNLWVSASNTSTKNSSPVPGQLHRQPTCRLLP